MKQKVFTLLTLLVLCVTGAWAGDPVTIGYTNTTATTAKQGTTETLTGSGEDISVAKLAVPSGSEAISEYTTGDKAMNNGNGTSVYSTHAYKWNKNTGSTVDDAYCNTDHPNEYVGFSFTVATGKTFSISGIAAKLASSANHVFRIRIENAGGTVLYTGTSKTINRTSDNEQTISDLTSDNAANIQNLPAGTYKVKAFLAFNSTGKYFVFTKLQVTGTVNTAVIDNESPEITTDLNDEAYETVVGTPVNLTIAANHTETYQWFSNDSKSTEGAEAIDGATTSTYAYTPSTATTKYFYCVATNSHATGSTTATSKIATVISTASSDASVKSVTVVANGRYTASASGTTYSATIGGKTSASVIIEPNEATAIVTCGMTVGTKGASIEVAATAGTPLEFTITAGDGTTSIDYTLNITKAEDKVVVDNTYYLAASEAIYGGQKIVGDDISMEFSKEESNYWRTAVDNSKISGIDANYVASTEGNSVNGCSYSFTPNVAGTLEVAVICNGGKTFTIDNAVSFEYNGVNESDDDASVSGSVATNTLAVPSGNKYDMIVTTSVEAGTIYKFYAAGGSKLGFFGFKFAPEKVEFSTLSGRNYGTTVTPAGKKLNFASVAGDAKAYIVTGLNGAKNKVMIQSIDVIPANTPILLYTTTQGATVNVPVTDADASDVSKSVLVAGDGTTTWDGTPGYSYLYISNDSFKKATSGTLKSGKAYAKIASGDLAGHDLSFGFEEGESEGEVTAIAEMKTIKNVESKTFYDLSGRRVAQPTKGLYIMDGKKVIVK